MVIGFFDCFSGVAGDMILGALFDVGLPYEPWREQIEMLNLEGYEILVCKTQQHHLKATDVLIELNKKQPQRSYQTIKTLLEESPLSSTIKKQSIAIFHRLAEAEATIHDCSVDTVHFHEVGAVDSIIDIVGAVIGFQQLGINKLYCSPLPLGSGFTICQHGKIPIPAPATLALLQQVPVYQTKRKQELVTPTAAAILTTIVTSFGEMPPLTPLQTGYGAGKTQSEYPAVVRLILGEPVRI